MTTMTFESINYSPRRAAARRHARPAPRVHAPEQASIAVLRQGNIGIGANNKRGLIALFCLAVVLHLAIISFVNRQVPVTAAPPKAEPLTIDIAPPPPPPPEIKPKLLPRLAKPLPAPAKPAPSVPIAPVDTTAPTADTVQVAPSAPPTPAPVPLAAPVEPVTEARGYAGYLSNPAPVYPVLAQDRGWQGQVILAVHVLASGRADKVTVAKSSGHKILDDAAIKAVLAWAFDPAKRGQTAIDGWVKVPLNFKLS